MCWKLVTIELVIYQSIGRFILLAKISLVQYFHDYYEEVKHLYTYSFLLVDDTHDITRQVLSIKV